MPFSNRASINRRRPLLDRLLWLGSSVLFFLHIPAQADDWPQWMGPNRDGVWRETGIVSAIPPAGLPVQWRVSVKGGYSGPAVADNRVYLTDYDRREGDLVNSPNDRTESVGCERVLCFDAVRGKLLWKYEYECPYAISYAAGPRCTPTVAAGKVYALGAEGNLTCLHAISGAVLWSKDFKKEYRVATPIWGFCGHPLLVGKSLICLVGGAGSVVVAFDKDTGHELWRALSASEPGYCPPSIIQSAGRQQLLIWDADKLNSLDPNTGEIFWSQPLKPAYGMSIMAPRMAQIKSGDVLFASGIGRVGALYKLDAAAPGASVVWRGEPKTAVYCANSTPFINDQTLYGADCDTGMLTAVDLATGSRLWETAEPTTGGTRRGKHGTAFLVQHKQPSATDAADATWIFSETGDLILAKLTPDSYSERGRTHILDPTGECFGRAIVWSHPAFANRCIFARNDEELVCISLAE